MSSPQLGTSNVQSGIVGVVWYVFGPERGQGLMGSWPVEEIMDVAVAIKPDLDPAFVPAVLWNKAYQEHVEREADSMDVALALVRMDGVCFRYATRMLPQREPYQAWNIRYLERLLKFLLWQHGAADVRIHAARELVDILAAIYRPDGERKFDASIFGGKIFPAPLRVRYAEAAELPSANSASVGLGGHLDGCRIGFDLGGSDRKCAAVIDGKVVYSEEVPWNPYFQEDPQYHLDGIRDSLRRAAAHLPHVDAIGGSAAGVYVNNEVRVASLFRGVSEPDFEQYVRRMFLGMREEWGHVPFEVVNDGEVTALAGAMSIGDGALLGISMGTSLAAGYCDPDSRITASLNELAFAPVDFRADGPVDEWSGDHGCGVQYFSQQGVARLATAAGYVFGKEVSLADRLVEIQSRLAQGDVQARRIFATIGTCFGYAIAHYAAFYTLRHVLILGRVTSGEGGSLIVSHAQEVLERVFPALADQLDIRMPDEQMKRHGQAVAAASLPALK
jgi:predicted NBD/HSP70 family sugar kinase